MVTNIVVPYQGEDIQFRDDGWLNATIVANRFDKVPMDWLKLVDTASYIGALAKRLGNPAPQAEINKIKDLHARNMASPQARSAMLRAIKSTNLVVTKSGPPSIGGGTWLHPKLAVVFARWLDDDFAVWCDENIDNIIHGKVPLDWHQIRREAAVGYKVMSEVLQEAREADGKDTKAVHYMNEARLLNGVITGDYSGRDRDRLTAKDLDMLAYLEVHNTAMLARGIHYTARKKALKSLHARYLMRRLPGAKNVMKIKVVKP